MIDVPVVILQWRLKVTLAGCILMMCVLVRSYTTFQDLLHSHPNGFFVVAIFEHCSLRFYNNMQTISESETSETVCQDSNLLVDTSVMDYQAIFDASTCAVLV